MNKRLLALLMSLTFVFSMSVSASAKTLYVPPVDTDYGEIATQAGASTTVSGSGTVTYIDMEVYSVVLPTDKVFDFNLDPQGLLGVVSGTTVEIRDLQGGRIIGNENPAPFINNSSVPILLTASAVVTGSATTVSYASVATTLDQLKVTTENGIAMYIVPSTEDMKLTSEEATNFGFSMAEEGFLLTTDNPVDLVFALEQAKYNVYPSGNAVGTVAGVVQYEDYYIELVSNSGCGNALTVGGIMNPNADWKDYTGKSPAETIKLEVVFTFRRDLTPDSNDTNNAIGAHALVSNAGLKIYNRMAVESLKARQTYPEGTGFITLGSAGGLTTNAGTWTNRDKTDLTVGFYLADADKNKAFTVAWGGAGTTPMTANVDYKLNVNKNQFTILGGNSSISGTTTTGNKTVTITVGTIKYVLTFVAG